MCAGRSARSGTTECFSTREGRSPTRSLPWTGASALPLQRLVSPPQEPELIRLFPADRFCDVGLASDDYDETKDSWAAGERRRIR